MPRSDPILFGDERVMPSEQRRRRSRPEISTMRRALAWAILVEGVCFRSPGEQDIPGRGHRVAAGKSSRVGSSQEGLPSKICGS